MEEDKEDSPEAPATSDPAAITKEDYETYLMRENGHFYTQAKADGQFSHLTEVYILQAVQFFYPAANCWVHISYPKFRFFLRLQRKSSKDRKFF